ncbi:hypothetical protein Patl1_25500 [Pistacia atlantica]|uniref:Uncharacterized protein n=1 Tax=Pistacia atlantica TaxID=434234 RepID=A0ACC1B1W3_9ROSI|nr:hypothetical protein Patl1_25500 [Pistacia atlantica]
MAMQIFNHHIRLPPKLLITPSMSMNRLSRTLSSPVMASGRIGLTSKSHSSHGLCLIQHCKLNETFPNKITATNRRRRFPPNNKQTQPSRLAAGANEEAVTETKQDEEDLRSEEEKKEHELRWGFITKVYGILVAQFMFSNLLYARGHEDVPSNSILLHTKLYPFIVSASHWRPVQNDLLNSIFLGLYNMAIIAVGVSLADLHLAIPNESLGKFLLSNYTITVAVAVIAGFIQLKRFGAREEGNIAA